MIAVVRDLLADRLCGMQERGSLGILSPRRISARYSSLNFVMEDWTGAATESDRTQMVVPIIWFVTSTSVSRSSSVPRPSSIRFRIFATQAEPSRQGVH